MQGSFWKSSANQAVKLYWGQVLQVQVSGEAHCQAAWAVPTFTSRWPATTIPLSFTPVSLGPTAGQCQKANPATFCGISGLNWGDHGGAWWVLKLTRGGDWDSMAGRGSRQVVVPVFVSPEANSCSEIWPQFLSGGANCIFSKPSNMAELGRLS